MKTLQDQDLTTGRQIPPLARSVVRVSMPMVVRTATLGLVAVISAAGLSACATSKDSSKDGSNSYDRTVVIDSSATYESQTEVKLDGLTGSFYYSTNRTAGGIRPVVQMSFTPTDTEEPKSFRTKVELRQDGNLLDAYYIYDDQSSLKNERLIDDVLSESSIAVLPMKTGPRHDGTSDAIVSKTGTDFEFTLTDMDVADTPFSPTEKVRRAAPTFADTPEDQFNKLAYERRWPVSKSFTSSSSMSGAKPDLIRAPAIAMQSFIQQVNDKATSPISPSSPTQAFQEWMSGWNPDMLAAGISMLGDDAIKETYRRVQAGDIERWFGGGTYVVGTGPNQIPPGTYQATATPDN
ncbi:MAG: hypothetical protein L0H03_16695, partial [Rhodococcus sp. (in: high G+C Gram-positive bacteria)]|nr:hypothetical protein [Rhodococcus sp. (in: high G+C Gram-positive bacteria)]